MLTATGTSSADESPTDHVTPPSTPRPTRDQELMQDVDATVYSKIGLDHGDVSPVPPDTPGGLYLMMLNKPYEPDFDELEREANVAARAPTSGTMTSPVPWPQAAAQQASMEATWVLHIARGKPQLVPAEYRTDMAELAHGAAEFLQNAWRCAQRAKTMQAVLLAYTRWRVEAIEWRVAKRG